MELHMVFYNAKYLNKEIAMDMDDGLVVLAALYEVNSYPFSNLVNISVQKNFNF